MELLVEKVSFDVVATLREQRRRELNCQLILYSWPSRGWADGYALKLDGKLVGYAAVGGNPHRDVVTEFYLPVKLQPFAKRFMAMLIETSSAKAIETQSNDLQLTILLFDFVRQIESHCVVFEEGIWTNLANPGAVFRETRLADHARMSELKLSVESQWVLEQEGSLVAAGQLLFHYNEPFADIAMETIQGARRKGFGSYLVQELKRAARAMGKIPAARCNAVNPASRATLEKAGMRPCARTMAGPIDLSGPFPSKLVTPG